jgi:hypothetical protein
MQPEEQKIYAPPATTGLKQRYLVLQVFLIGVLMVAGCHRKGILPVKDEKSVAITLRRASYSVTVDGTGGVVFEGREGVPTRGTHISNLPPGKLSAILRTMDDARFMSMDDGSFLTASDAPYVTISIAADGTKKQIRSVDLGGDHNMRFSLAWFNRDARQQAQFLQLGDEIDSLIGTSRWTTCSPKCMILVKNWSHISETTGEGSTILVEAIKSKKNFTLGSNPRTAIDFPPTTMIEAGVDVNMADGQGQTPLMAAAKNGEAELVRDLLAHGANPNARDKKGLSAMDCAITDDTRSLLAAAVYRKR